MAGLVQVGVVVDHGGLEEQQLAASFESAHGIGIFRVAVEKGPDVHAQFRHIGIAARVGAQEETCAGRQAKTKVILPVRRQREAAIDVERKAGQINIQRNIQTGADDATTQVHVKAD